MAGEVLLVAGVEVVRVTGRRRVVTGLCAAAVAWVLLLLIPGVLYLLRHSEQTAPGFAGPLVVMLGGLGMLLATIGYIVAGPARDADQPHARLAAGANLSAMLALPTAFVLVHVWLLIRLMLTHAGP